MELIVRLPRHYHVSQDTVEELETAILSDERVVPAQINPAVESVLDGAVRLLRRAGVDAGAMLRVSSRSATSERPERDYFAVMMRLDAVTSAPWFVRRARRSIYLFDAWPGRYADITKYTESWGIQYAFVSSSQAAARLGEISERCTFIWVPEGVDPSRYQQRSWIEKDIDVLQLGRKYDAHHAAIAQPLENSGHTYLYERQKGGIVFPTRADFVAGLARSRISICVPSSMTHPERAGDVETMTIRYLQSIVSKCLVLGHAPAEMIELFGYNPVIETDMHDPVGQVLHILDNYEDYLPLIEKNFDAVIGHHTWRSRWERMAVVLFSDVSRPRAPRSTA